MPIYEFWCPHCEVVTTEFCSMGEKSEIRMCAECGHIGLLKKITGFNGMGLPGENN